MPTLKLVVPEETLLSIDEKRSIMETMRKWNIKYDGRQDPFMFIERIEKGTDSYGIYRILRPKYLETKLRLGINTTTSDGHLGSLQSRIPTILPPTTLSREIVR